jgi:hypothetical protein
MKITKLEEKLQLLADNRLDEIYFIVVSKLFDNEELAIQEIDRIRELFSSEYIQLIQHPLVKTRREGTVAEFAPLFVPEHFRRTKVERYTKLEAEKEWRTICDKNDPTKEDIDTLINIAEGFEIQTKSRDAKYICKLIEKQYEAEFGERARMREIREKNEREIEKYMVEVKPEPKKAKSKGKKNRKKGKEKI